MNKIPGTCKICSQEVEDILVHIKSHKISRKNYFEKYHQRLDLLTGEKIEFENYDNYFWSDFTSKTNFSKWLKTQTKEVQLGHLKNKLLQRKKEKGMKYIPGQFELRSFGFPGINYFEKLGINYFDWMEGLVFKKEILS